MMLNSKTDRALISGFEYSGKMKTYLEELDFEEARAVFVTRYRMLPTKANFPGRWEGQQCNICGFLDVDEHIFNWPGYKDLINDDMSLEMFWDDNMLKYMEKLSCAAKTMKMVYLTNRKNTVYWYENVMNKRLRKNEI